MATWQFPDGSPENVQTWSELTVRDAEQPLIWAPLMYPAGPAAEGAIRSKYYGKGANIIRTHSEFRNKPGETLTIHNVARVNGQPAMGDVKAKEQSHNLATYTQDLKYDAARHVVTDSGKLQGKKTVLPFKANARKELSSLARRTSEGLINAHLYGISAPSNTTVLTRLNLPSSLATVFRNDVKAFDSDHIQYAGSKASDAEVAADSSAVLTAAELDVFITMITEDLDIPLEPADIDGEEGFLVPIPARGVEQLRADPDFNRHAQQYDGQLNVMLKRKLVKYGPLVFFEYPNHLQPAANVGRLLALGKDALQFVKVMDWEWWEGVDDTNDWFSIIALACMMGAQATYFNSARRNSAALDFYVRS